MKGIILSAGKGTRLYPSTISVPKALMPVYDKPLIYYPLSLMIKMDIKEVLIIIAPETEPLYTGLLGDGSHLGMKISYKVQPVARGIADGLIMGEEFLGDESCFFVLGDNILYDKDIDDIYSKVKSLDIDKVGACVFGLWVENPRPFGVVEFDESGKVISIEEKPLKPKSNYIIPGYYFYDNKAVSIAKSLTPSARGELEITDLNKVYLENGELNVLPLSQSSIWFDAGTADNLLLASSSIHDMHKRGIDIGYAEYLAYEKGNIDRASFEKLAGGYPNEYGKNLLEMGDNI